MPFLREFLRFMGLSLPGRNRALREISVGTHRSRLITQKAQGGPTHAGPPIPNLREREWV